MREIWLLVALFVGACAISHQELPTQQEAAKPEAKPETPAREAWEPPEPIRRAVSGEWVSITSAKQFDKTMNKYQFIVAIFGAEWCKPCHKVVDWWNTRLPPRGWTFLYWKDPSTAMFWFSRPFVKVMGRYRSMHNASMPFCAVLVRSKQRGRVVYARTYSGFKLRECTDQLDQWLEQHPEAR